MTRTPDLLIVGGGIGGLCSALAAAQRGVRVLVVDDARSGAASRAAAGMLAPSVEGLPPDAHAVAIEARDAYPDFLAALRERADVDVKLDRNGILELALSASELAQWLARPVASAHQLDARALARFEPAFAGHAGAVLHPDDGAVDNVALMRALDMALAHDARIDRLSDRITSLDFSANRPTATTPTGERIECEHVLLASGAWGGTDIVGLPRVLPVRPVRGELLLLDSCPVRHVTYGAGGYLVPRGDRLLIGATSDETGFASHPTDAGRSSLLAIARRAVPALNGARVVDHWAGLRPVSLDGLPILGLDPDTPGLVYACGFSRNGILLAPWAATHLARVICGDPPARALEQFSSTRFEGI